MKNIDFRKMPRIVQDEARKQAMRMRVELSLTFREIANVVGVNINTVIGWNKKYHAEGEDALKSNRRGRRFLSGRTLTLEQEWQLRTTITSENPNQMCLPFALWNRRAVMELIKTLYGIDMPIRTVGEYLLRWGFTPQRPIKRALERDPIKVQTWLENVYPMIAKRAAEEKAVIYWGDETAVSEEGNWVRGYAPRGKTPVLERLHKRFGLSMISAISNSGLVRFSFTEGAINAIHLISFMEKLISDCDQKIFLILDNLKSHHAKIVTKWLSENKEKIEVFYLPPYSPELNPDEYLNRDFKDNLQTASTAIDFRTLLKKAQKFMGFLMQNPSHVASYFQHSCAKYASSTGI